MAEFKEVWSMLACLDRNHRIVLPRGIPGMVDEMQWYVDGIASGLSTESDSLMTELNPRIEST